jgi:hypothetical protein
MSRARESTLYTLPLHLGGAAMIGLPIALIGIMRSGDKPPKKEERNFLLALWGVLAGLFLALSVRACYKAELKTEIAKDNGTYKEDPHQ